MLTRGRLLSAWDALVAAFIIMSAVEVPYAIGVGYQSLAVERLIDTVYAIVFGVDILVSCSAKARSSPGRRQNTGLETQPSLSTTRRGWWVRFRQRPSARYLLSWRFAGDFAAAVPWSWITGSEHARALVMARSLRIVRLLKFFRLVELSGHRSGVRKLSRLLRVHPALGRLAMSLILAIWLAHVLACVLVAVHPGLNDGVAPPYANAIYGISVTLLTGEPMDGLPLSGRIVAFMGLLASLLLVGGLIANLASMISDFDRRRLIREDLGFNGHTVLLGYNDAVPAIIDQLSSDDGMMLHARGRRPVVVIVSGRATDDIWKQILDRCQNPDRLEIRISKGDPSASSVLRYVGVARAAHVVAFGEVDPGASEAEADAQVLKSIMSVVDCLKASLVPPGSSSQERTPSSIRLVMVAMSKSRLLASMVEALPHGAADVGLQLRIVCPGEMMIHVLAHSTVSPPLASIYEDLVTYELEGEEPGCEIYRVRAPLEACGGSFEDLATGYRSAAAIGLLRNGRLSIGAACLTLGPVESGDDVVLVAESLQETVWSKMKGHGPAQPAEVQWLEEPEPLRVMIMGEGAPAEDLASALEARLPGTSKVRRWHDPPERSAALDWNPGAAPHRSRRRVGEIVAAASDDLRDCDRVVLMSDAESASQRDAEVMLGLATIMAVSSESVRPTVLAEMVAPDRASLRRWFDEPIITSTYRMLAGYVVQLLHDHVRADVFKALVGAEGRPVLTLRRLALGPMGPGQRVEYGWIRDWGLRRGLCVVGYVGPDHKVIMVPRLDLQLAPGEIAQVIVVAQASSVDS